MRQEKIQQCGLVEAKQRNYFKEGEGEGEMINWVKCCCEVGRAGYITSVLQMQTLKLREIGLSELLTLKYAACLIS